MFCREKNSIEISSIADKETQVRMDAFEAKFIFSQVVGCVDGTHILLQDETLEQ